MVGEHIRALKGGQWVHAIDCGDQTVLHLAEDQSPRRVRRAYRPEFVSGAETVELVTHRERTFPPNEVVRRAYSRAGDPTLAAAFSDSRAFAEWCTTGRSTESGNFAVEVPGPADAPASPARRPAARRQRWPAARGKARPRQASKRAPKRKRTAKSPKRAARTTASRRSRTTASRVQKAQSASRARRKRGRRRGR